MYIVTAFALSYSTTNLGMSRDLFLNIGLLVGAISCVTIPCFAWLADRFGLKRIYLIGAAIGLACSVPFFVALEARATVWIVIFSVLLANVAHDMVVSVQQPLFTELFGAEYRYSGAWRRVSIRERRRRRLHAVHRRRADQLRRRLVAAGWRATWRSGCLLSLVVGARIKAA